MATKTKPTIPIDVLALLDRLDTLAGLPDGAPSRQGQWLVERWWRLRVAVIADHRYLGNGRWEPGVFIDCCDRQGRFGTHGFVRFDECRLTAKQIERTEQFIRRWEKRRAACKHRKLRQKAQTTAAGTLGGVRA